MVKQVNNAVKMEPAGWKWWKFTKENQKNLSPDKPELKKNIEYRMMYVEC
jgi:hypothetical protein